MNFLRPLLLLCVLAIGVGVLPPVRQPFAHALQAALDNFDRRPVRNVLIIGNSRTYAHDMPFIVREIADSARSPVRYAITVRAWGGASFEDNWKDGGVRQLLRQRWDYVLLQAESRAQVSDANRASFETYGEKLAADAKSAGSPVALIVNWGYGEALYQGDRTNERERYVAAIQSAHRELARRTGADLINVGAAWEEIHGADPSLALYEDGNHPTVAGSYLTALMIYDFLSGDSVREPRFRPGGIDESTARTIRRLLARYLSEPTGSSDERD